jgi:hypothetical protein
MNWHRRLATLLVMLALTACAQGCQAPYVPSSPEYTHDRGGDGGCGGGDMMQRAESDRVEVAADGQRDGRRLSAPAHCGWVIAKQPVELLVRMS